MCGSGGSFSVRSSLGELDVVLGEAPTLMHGHANDLVLTGGEIGVSILWRRLVMGGRLERLSCTPRVADQISGQRFNLDLSFIGCESRSEKGGCREKEPGEEPKHLAATSARDVSLAAATTASPRPV